MQSTQIPNIKWAQRKDRIFITIDVINMKSPLIDIVDGRTLKFSGTGENKASYAFDLKFYDEVNKEESKYTLDSRNIFLNIKKKTKGPYWPRLTEGTQKLQWLNNDWNLYIDEDEEDEEKKAPAFGGGNEMSKLF
jgi:prostaglandin-E synthase